MTLFRIFEKLNVIETMLKKDFPDKWLSLKEVCRYTGLSVSTINRAITKGRLKVAKGSGRLLFKRSWLDEWLEG